MPKNFISHREFTELRERSPTYEDFIENFQTWAIQKYEREHGYPPSELARIFLMTEIRNVESLKMLYGYGDIGA